MGRWKEKRKPFCNKVEHAEQLIELRNKIKELDSARWDDSARFRNEVNGKETTNRNLQIQLQAAKEEKRELEIALTKTALLLEVQGKQFRVIKEVLSFFEPDKPLTQAESEMFSRGENGTNYRTNQDSSRAKS